MNELALLGTVCSAIALVVCYTMMTFAKGSPRRLLGREFRVPDMRLRFTPDMLYKTFDDAGDEGRKALRRFWLYDFGFMAGLTGVMIAVSANVTGTALWLYWVMAGLSVLRTVADATENLLFLSLLRRYPARMDGRARLSGAVTTIKHALLFVWLLPLFFHLALAAFRIKL